MTNQPSNQDTEQPPPRDFAAFLLELAKGKTHRELSTALRDIALGVQQTGKPGKLQLTLQFKQQKGTDALLISDDIKTSVPRFDRPASIFYATDVGDLQRTDPHQIAIPYDTVKEPTNS